MPYLAHCFLQSNTLRGACVQNDHVSPESLMCIHANVLVYLSKCAINGVANPILPVSFFACLD